MSAPLRIGLMLDGTQLKRWELWALQELAARDDATLAVAISRPPGTPPRGLARQLRRLRKLPGRLPAIPWLLVDGADRRFARRGHTAAAMEDVDLTQLSRSIPVIEAEPQASANGTVHRFAEADLERIRAYELDVLLRFGYDILKGQILQAARHGVWSFHHADNRVNRGAPPGFWEIARGDEVTGVTLQRLTEDLDNGHVLARGWYPTDRTSWNRCHQRIAARGRTLLIDAIDYLARHGEPPSAPEPPVNVYCHPLYRQPGPGAAVATAARSYGRPFGRKLRAALSRTQWHIRWAHADPANASIHRFHEITPPPDRLWADPFAHVHGGRVWLFVEELLYATGRGRIVALEVEGDRVRDHRVVLDQSYHLSYPFLFEHGGDLYLVPESNERASVQLWRCSRFPDDWEYVHDLLPDVHAADSSLLAHGERYYLFTTLARNASMDRSTELHIFHADDPLSQHWQPHAGNPVLVDCRSARMAGGFLFGGDGSLIRCAQRHGAEYGEAIELRRVTELAPDRYGEVPAGAVEPRWRAGLSGTHHLSSRRGILCIDACQSIARWAQRRQSVWQPLPHRATRQAGTAAGTGEARPSGVATRRWEG